MSTLASRCINSPIARVLAGGYIATALDFTTRLFALPFVRPRVWRGVTGIGLLGGVLALGGCATIRITDPPRTATEQFLLNQASSEAIAQISADILRDRTVYIDASYLIGDPKISEEQQLVVERPSAESLYILGELRSKLLMSGVRLVSDREAAQIILEVRSAGVGVDRVEFLLGIPGIGVPIQNVPVNTPELALLKNTRQLGFASVAYVAWWRDSGEVAASSGPYVGRTLREDWFFFGVLAQTVGDIPPTQKGDPLEPPGAADEARREPPPPPPPPRQRPDVGKGSPLEPRSDASPSSPPTRLFEHLPARSRAILASADTDTNPLPLGPPQATVGATVDR